MIVNGLEIEMMQSGGLFLLMTHSPVYYSCYLLAANWAPFRDCSCKQRTLWPALESLEQAELAPTLHRDESAESFFDT